jgi:hypothetical protein
MRHLGTTGSLPNLREQLEPLRDLGSRGLLPGAGLPTPDELTVEVPSMGGRW